MTADTPLLEHLKAARLFVQDCMDTQFVPKGAIGNLMSARDEIDAAIAAWNRRPAASPEALALGREAARRILTDQYMFRETKDADGKIVARALLGKE